MGKSPSETLRRIARYYLDQGYKSRQIPGLLDAFILRCDPYANMTKWQPTVEWCAKFAEKRPLSVIRAIPITMGELERIKALPGIRHQRVMFALLCLAKYGNAVNEKNNGWVNQAAKDVFALADTKVTGRVQALLLNELKEAGYIGFSSIIDNTNVRVMICDDNEEDVIARIDDFRSLGNQYMMLTGPGYMHCAVCGLTVKRQAFRQKYCKSCAAMVNIRRTSERRKTGAA